MIELNGKQLHAAECLASGLTPEQAAPSVGASERTIQRWNKLEEFKEQVRKRKAARSAAERINDARQAVKEGTVSDLVEGIRELLELKRKTRRQWLAASQIILNKVCANLQDLPPEAFTPQIMPQYFKAAAEMQKDAHVLWAEDLALDELLDKLLKDEQESTGDRS